MSLRWTPALDIMYTEIIFTSLADTSIMVQWASEESLEQSDSLESFEPSELQADPEMSKCAFNN